jgi:hypothetical protein
MITWSFAHSVEAAVAPDTAWRFWTDVSNWTFDTSLEWVRLDPGFVAGARGVTKPRGAEPIEWRVRDAGGGQATIDLPFPGAVVTFHWTFEPAGLNRTRLTQRVELSGPQAADYIAIAQSQLASGLPEGMRTLAEAMEQGSA